MPIHRIRPFRWMFWALAVAGLAAGCKCEREPEGAGTPAARDYKSTVAKLPPARVSALAALIPAEVDLAVLADQPALAWDWLSARPWFEALRKSPPADDLRLAGPLYRLSGLRHRVAALSPVRWQEAEWRELLASPTALALRLGEEEPAVLLVKRIDLKVQALDRLAELFNQVHPQGDRLALTEVEGVSVRSLAGEGDAPLHWAVFSDLLLVSNDAGLLGESVVLAVGKGSGALSADGTTAALLTTREPGAVVALARGELLSGPVQALWPLEMLGMQWRPGEAPRLQLSGLLAEEPPAAAPAPGAERLLPLDARMVLGSSALDLAALWQGLSGGEGADPKAPALEKSLLPKLGGRVLFVLGGFELVEGRPVPALAALVPLRAADGLEPVLDEAFEYLFGQRPEARQLAEVGGRTLHRISTGSLQAGYALLDGWLVLASTEGLLRRFAAVSAGQAPAIRDLPGFADRLLGVEPFAGLVYVDCGRLFEDATGYARALLAKGSRVQSPDLEQTWGPVFEALRGLGRLGGGLKREGPRGLSGEVVPL